MARPVKFVRGMCRLVGHGTFIGVPHRRQPFGERRFYKPVARKPLAICVRIVRAHKPEFLVMLKGFAISVICIGTLVAVDYELNDGIYTDQVLGMLRQIHYSFER